MMRAPQFPGHPKGFALVVTLSLMILLTILAVGLLTLSSVSLRQSASGEAMAQARQNARLSIQLALGQLQSLSGQDTRVTASSRMFDTSHAVQTGVWRSWEGTDHDSDGRPNVPRYDTKMKASQPADPPGASDQGRFLGWLSSPTAFDTTPDPAAFPNSAKVVTADYVPMIADASVTDPDGKVYLKPTMVRGTGGNMGALAWWTGGNNAKAMINTDASPKPTTAVDWQLRVRSNGQADAKTMGLANLHQDYDGKVSLPSDKTFQLVTPASDLRKFHDLTSSSRGLLTNTATGGWRKDMSLMTERYASLPSTGLPFFTLAPGKDQTASKASPSSFPPNALLYPWSNYRATAGSPGWAQVPPICSWDALVDYTQQYRQLDSMMAARTSMPSFCIGSGDRYNFQEKVRRAPQISRVQWIYSLGSVLSSQLNDPTGGPARWGTSYLTGLLVTPVLTLWNPYNVELSINNFGLTIQETAPLMFSFSVAGVTYPPSTLSEISKAGTGYERFNLLVNQPIILRPGASRIFSLASKIPIDNAGAASVLLVPGYTPRGGYLFYGINKGNNVYAAATDSFAVESISYDGLTNEGKNGRGIVFDILIDNLYKAAHHSVYDVNEMGGTAVMDALYPPLTRRLAAKVGEVAGEFSQPVASALFGYRMASAMPADPRLKHLFSKGMLQTNPLCYYSELGFGDDVNAVTSMAGSGVYHPINAPYDFAFEEIQGWNDVRLPQWDIATGSSFIVSGLQSNDGLTRCVMAELPTRPLQSLADLEHFDARNNNPITPYQFNLIGNGSAQPVFAPTQTYVTTSYNNGMCNDDCYNLNHVLFDDWFFSSIAPDLQNFSAVAKRPIQTVYEDHLKGTTRLPNRFYLPTDDAAAPTVAEAVARDFTPPKAYQTIASKLEVEGMFNLNSVSLDAWKAILRQGRDAKVPYLDGNGRTVLGAASSYAFPRTSIAGDMGTDSSAKTSGLFAGAAEIAGQRVLTDVQIDALASQIVTEIKKRGPFLSLAEFVNRQLVTDKDRAIAGTIQKALDNLAQLASSPSNPYQALQARSVQITAPPPGNTDYKFPEAALGWSLFGVPGWVRQADILRPLAPIVSVRDDTFTIRAYGDARAKDDATKIVAKAWCEVIVRRQAEFLDTRDAATVQPYSTAMTQTVNKTFGRRYRVVSFRWLSPSEI
jgi:hypothetical protein